MGDFFKAVKDGFKKYFQVSGRSTRSEFWYFTLFIVLVSLPLVIIDAALYGMSLITFIDSDRTGILNGIWALITFVPSITVSIRRLHDINRNGLWLLIIFTGIGIIPLLYWICKEGNAGVNLYGANPLQGYSSSLSAGQNSPVNKSKNRIFKIIGIFLAVCFSLLMVLGMIIDAGIFPDTAVVEGKHLTRFQVKALVGDGLIYEDQVIDYFYSEAFLDITAAGQFLTSEKVVSYFENEGELELYEIPYSEIEKIELVVEGSYIEDSQYRIYGNDESDWEYINIVLSVEADGDKRFLEHLKKKIIECQDTEEGDIQSDSTDEPENI